MAHIILSLPVTTSLVVCEHMQCMCNETKGNTTILISFIMTLFMSWAGFHFKVWLYDLQPSTAAFSVHVLSLWLCVYYCQYCLYFVVSPFLTSFHHTQASSHGLNSNTTHDLHCVHITQENNETLIEKFLTGNLLISKLSHLIFIFRVFCLTLSV